RYAHVETVAFDYGQRHRIELDARLNVLRDIRARFPQWAPRLGEDHLLDLKVLGQVGDTAMTSDRAIEMQANGLPNTFVPGRNLLFLTLAAALGYRRQLDVLVGGTVLAIAGYLATVLIRRNRRVVEPGIDRSLRDA
ncbi:7-cyano-7-deazaguanine synthase, partial [Cupriavidus sp. SIMBA_020]|uniref:7-cyano-7-deazaguanine synthase n=1 Tax=Cupriavidus sp. SIMBA_020 TaxID=3085766 RepID=UPI00397B0A85